MSILSLIGSGLATGVKLLSSEPVKTVISEGVKLAVPLIASSLSNEGCGNIKNIDREMSYYTSKRDVDLLNNMKGYKTEPEIYDTISSVDTLNRILKQLNINIDKQKLIDVILTEMGIDLNSSDILDEYKSNRLINTNISDAGIISLNNPGEVKTPGGVILLNNDVNLDSLFKEYRESLL